MRGCLGQQRVIRAIVEGPGSLSGWGRGPLSLFTAQMLEYLPYLVPAGLRYRSSVSLRSPFVSTRLLLNPAHTQQMRNRQP